MKINFDYIDNDIIINDEDIECLEIENKNYFYRIINDLICISNGEIKENIKFFNNGNELNLSNKIDVIIDYFNFDFNSKRIVNLIYQSISSNITEEAKDKINSYYKKIKNIVEKGLTNYILPLKIEDEYDINVILKMLKIAINKKDTLLENIFLLIDIENIFKINELVVFVNLKQYLNKEELEEVYKYCIYNNVKIMLIDSQCYGTTAAYEKKLIIDGNLDEFLL